jgi:hypothetical protein
MHWKLPSHFIPGQRNAASGRVKRFMHQGGTEELLETAPAIPVLARCAVSRLCCDGFFAREAGWCCNGGDLGACRFFDLMLVAEFLELGGIDMARWCELWGVVRMVVGCLWFFEMVAPSVHGVFGWDLVMRSMLRVIWDNRGLWSGKDKVEIEWCWSCACAWFARLGCDQVVKNWTITLLLVRLFIQFCRFAVLGIDPMS